MKDVIHLLLSRFIDLFTLSHVSNGNQQGSMSIWLAALSCVISMFNVTAWSFEEQSGGGMNRKSLYSLSNVEIDYFCVNS